MSSTRLLSVKSTEALDKYTESIDFSNACREFYMNRVKATENFKKRMSVKSGDEETPAVECPTRKKSGIESAMEKLRTEMVSLMDQDLCLMRQLLTLNEAIEDIKTKRLYGMSKNSLHADSRDLSNSELYLSDSNFYLSEDDVRKLPTSQTDNDIISDVSTSENGENSKFANTEILVNGKPVHCFHAVQRSIDSGYDESDNYQTDIEATL